MTRSDPAAKPRSALGAAGGAARGALARGRGLAAWLSGSVRRAAIAWGAATLVLLLALGGGPGVSRDEAAVLAAADPTLSPGAPPAPAPPLPAALAAATGGLLAPLGVPPLRAARAATALAGGLLSVAMVALAWDLAGPAAALLAPALFWAAPRHLHAGLVAGPDLLLAALSLVLALAWRRAFSEKEGRRRLRAALLTGALLGAALASRADAWALGIAVALEAGVSRALRLPSAGGDPPRASRVALFALAVAGPLLLVAAWPALLGSPAARAAAIGLPSRGAAAAALGGLASSPVLSAAFPLAALGLTVPLALLLVLAAGLAHAAFRLARAVSGRAPREEARPELLLLLLALAPLAAAAAGMAPRAAGVRPVLHALPFLAVLGARALVHAARLAWPARATPLATSLALLALWPAVRACVHFHPTGGAAYAELAGGAPGAASLGLPRQEGGEAAARLLEAVAARARPGARVYWPTSSPAAVRALARDGRVRPDLAFAAAPDEADLAIVTLDGADRDGEYRSWAAFRSSRPVAGVYVDEVPLGFVYAARGAWR